MTFTVRQRGTDSSSRGIYASDYMWDWWERVIDELPFGEQVVITQGAWMSRNGGGAAASAGYHDKGGCFDLRVWNLTSTQVRELVWALRRNGAAAWLRNLQHGGFDDPHIHLVLGSDADLADGAAYQWRDYIAGGDGMGGRDYHPRPEPLITRPPEDPMAQYADQLKRIEEQNKEILKRLNAKAAIRTRLAALAKQGRATAKDLAELKALVEDED